MLDVQGLYLVSTYEKNLRIDIENIVYFKKMNIWH